jgi:flagellar biosynthesis protein FlhF
MRIQKFQASSMKDALALIKRELGPDAMVVATASHKKGIEVTAAVEDGAAELPAAAYGPRPTPKAPGLSEEDVERIMAPLRSEIRSLRSLVRSIAEERGDGDIRGELQAVRQAIAALGRGTDEQSLAAIAARGPLTAKSTKRIVALVGPTGVGKTTSIAKLAARTALVEHKSVAILTLDNYRVGGEDQMRTFADLIGAPLTLVSNPDEMVPAIAAHKGAHRIYIDTAGRSPKDERAIAELARAFAPIRDLEVHLTVSATTAPTVLDGVFRRYKPIGIDHLLITKLDEGDDLGELVRAPARFDTTICHVATGQRVPVDIEDATDEILLALAQPRAEVAA